MKWAWILLIACHSPTEVQPTSAKQEVCVTDEHTPKGCCLVDGMLDCPDVEPPRVE